MDQFIFSKYVAMHQQEHDLIRSCITQLQDEIQQVINGLEALNTLIERGGIVQEKPSQEPMAK